MMRVLIGDLFASGAQTLVNTVNCVGVMGKGVALEFKTRFPEMFEDYVRRCEAKEVRLGRPYLYQRASPPWILNFPTKDHWRSVSNLKDIEAGLEYLEKHYQEWGITSLAVPPLGCGQGQLEWQVVGPTLYRHLSRLAIDITLYAPPDTPQEELDVGFLSGKAPAPGPAEKQSPRVLPAWIVLVEVVSRVSQERYHWPIGRTAFQKLAYFATAKGLPTGLRHSRGSYGPFAADLKAQITRLVNNGLIEEKKTGRMFAIQPGPTYPDARRGYQQDLERWEPVIRALEDLFMRLRFNQAEVAATVHFVAEELAANALIKPSEKDVFQGVKAWKQKRRPPLEDAEIASTIRNLNVLGWINVEPSKDLPTPAEEWEDDLPLSAAEETGQENGRP